MFWKVFKKYPMIISYQEKISYPDLQDMLAIILMEEDYDKANAGFDLVKTRQMQERTKGK